MMLPTIANTSKKKKEVEKPRLFFNFTNQGLSLDDRNNNKTTASDTSRTMDTERNSELEQYTTPSHPMNWQTHRDTPWGQCVEVISSRKKGWIDRFASQLDESCIVETKTIEEMKEEKLKESGWTNIKIPYSSLSPPKDTRKKDSFKKYPFSADRMTTCVTCLASVNKNIEVVGCIRCDVVIHFNCIKDVQRYVKKKPASSASSSATSTASSSSFVVDNIGGGGGGAKRRRTNQNSMSTKLSPFNSASDDGSDRPYTAPVPTNSHNHKNNSTLASTTTTTNIIKSKDLDWLCDFCHKDSIINSIYFEKKQHREVHKYNRLLSCIRLQAFFRMCFAKLKFYKFRHGITVFQQVIRMRKFAKLAEMERINQHYVFKIRIHELKVLSLDPYYSTITDSNTLEKLILPFPVRRYPYLIGKISSTKYEKALNSFLNKQHSLAAYTPPVIPAPDGPNNSGDSNSQPSSNSNSNNAIQIPLNMMKEQKLKQDQEHRLATAGRVSFRGPVNGGSAAVAKPSSAAASSESNKNNQGAGYPGSPPLSANPFFTTASASVRFNVQPDNTTSGLNTARSNRLDHSRASTPNKSDTHSIFGDDFTVGDDTTVGGEEDKEQELFDILFQGGTHALENPAYAKPYREMQILMKGTLFLTVTVYEHHSNDSTTALEATTSAHNQIFSNTTSTQSVINLLEANFADPYYSASIQTYRYDLLLKHNSATTKLKPGLLSKMGHNSSEFDSYALEKLCKIYNLDSYIAAKSLLLIPYSHANVTIKFTLSEVSDWPKATVIGQSTFHPQHFIVRKKVVSLHQDLLSSSKLTNEDLPIPEDGGKISLQLPKNYTVSSAYSASGRRMTVANIAATASDEHSLLHPKDLQSKAIAKTAKNLLSPVQEPLGKRKFSSTGRNPMKLIDVKYPILSWTFLAAYKNEGHDYGFLMILNPVSFFPFSLVVLWSNPLCLFFLRYLFLF
jgi:hypothetical protein